MTHDWAPSLTLAAAQGAGWSGDGRPACSWPSARSSRWSG